MPGLVFSEIVVPSMSNRDRQHLVVASQDVPKSRKVGAYEHG